MNPTSVPTLHPALFLVGGLLRFNTLGSGLQDQSPVPGDEGIPTIRNFRFSNIRVKDVPVLVDGISIHPHKPLNGFSLINVSGSAGKGISLANIRNARIRNIKVTGFAGPLLSINNVTGTGLKGAVTIDPPKLPAGVRCDSLPTTLVDLWRRELIGRTLFGARPEF